MQQPLLRVQRFRRAASLCCPFQQPSCAFRWSAPDGLERLGDGPAVLAACELRPAGALGTLLFIHAPFELEDDEDDQGDDKGDDAGHLS